MAVNPTAQKILDLAQQKVQTNGFNGFSYRDLAAEIGIKSSSIHYHFSTKDDLVLALVTAYRAAFNLELAQISASDKEPRSQLAMYVKLFENNLATDNKFCLCGMLASEVNSLSDRVKQAIQDFFLDNEVWLSQLITSGQIDGSFQAKSPPDQIAAQLLATFEGAMLIARSAEKDNVRKFKLIAEGVIQSIC